MVFEERVQETFLWRDCHAYRRVNLRYINIHIVNDIQEKEISGELVANKCNIRKTRHSKIIRKIARTDWWQESLIFGFNYISKSTATWSEFAFLTAWNFRGLRRKAWTTPFIWIDQHHSNKRLVVVHTKIHEGNFTTLLLRPELTDERSSIYTSTVSSSKMSGWIGLMS